MGIRLISHKDIDPAKWDDCISRFFNGCVYAYSWYLDRICDNWMALVDDDYETIMPLPISELNGKKIIDQPILARYLGIFTNKLITPTLLQEYLTAIPDDFLYVSLVLNKFNISTEISNQYSISKYPVYSVDLISGYTKLSDRYTRKAMEQIQLAHSQKIVVLSGIQPREFMSFYSKNSQKASDKLDEKDTRRLRSIISHALFHNFGEIYGAYDASNNLSAAVFLLGSHQKISASLFVQNSETDATAALYLIFDHFIKKNAEKNIVLSLETALNSKEKNNLFLDLGAISSDCVVLKKNNLPIWQRWMK